MPKKKSFLQKNFNAIVITFVVIIGGMYFFGKFLFPSATPSQSSMPAAQETANSAPQPAKTPAPANIAVSNTNGVVEVPNSPPPMPAPVDATNETASHSVPIAIDSGLTPMPGAKQEVPVPSAAVPQATITEKSNDLTPVLSNMGAGQSATPAKPAPVAQVQTVPTSVSASATSPDVMALNDRIATLEKNAAVMKAEKTDLQNKLNDSNHKIESLQASLDSESKKLDAISSAPAKTEMPASAAEISTSRIEMPTPIKATVKTETSSKPVKAKKPAPVKSAAHHKSSSHESASIPKVVLPLNTQWELRSAQTGRAMVAPKGSDDLKSIQVGDMLMGLGRITSIGIENGVWTVRGTKSAIYR